MTKRWLQVGCICGLLMTGVMLAGCGDDLYSQCTIEAEGDEALEQCVRGDDDEVSCAVENLECETGTCGRYRSSEAFCTIECTGDGDCPQGECREFVYQSGQQYCVSNVDLRDDE